MTGSGGVSSVLLRGITSTSRIVKIPPEDGRLLSTWRCVAAANSGPAGRTARHGSGEFGNVRAHLTPVGVASHTRSVAHNVICVRFRAVDICETMHLTFKSHAQLLFA